MPNVRLALGAIMLASCARGAATPSERDADWPVTGGDAGNGRYSTLAQITPANVASLRVAWTYHTGDASPDGRSQIQATPIVVHGVLYATSPALKVFALRAGTGERLWQFDPFVGRKAESHANRGVVYWESGSDRRILFTAGTRLYALDAGTGQPVASFGDSGWVDLAAGLGRDVHGEYLLATSPGVIYRDLLIQGTRVSESEGAAPGHVRAYDVRTGRVRWTFHTIPQPGEPNVDTWPPNAWQVAGGANSWPGMSVDSARGLVFVPTGSPTPDFYGGDRAGQNLYGNTLLALDAATGKRVWHFQTVHHDIWDRDLPAAPNLLTVMHGGRRVDAVAQITKSGFVFLFDRATGTPLFPVNERSVPTSDLPGEHAWSTQPEPSRPAPFARQRLTESDLTDRTPAAHDAVLARYRALRTGDLFTPPTRGGTIVFPGFDGGGEWGGAAVDRARGVLYVNGSDVPWIAEMVPPPSTPTAATGTSLGASVYAASCASCHRADRRGDGDRVPSLVDVGRRRSAAEIQTVIEHGRGFMPSFANLTSAQKSAVVAYVLGRPEPTVAAGEPHAAEPPPTAPRAPFRLRSYERWQDPDGYPAVKPPWGTLNAIDLNTGASLWKIPLGEHPELAASGLTHTGTEQYGGPIVTASGLVFIAATQDERFHAFDARNGTMLWETTLPAAGYATPSTYSVDGRQFVVIAAGGGKLGTKSGDAYVAFALPRQ